MIGEGRSALETATQTTIRGGGICINRLQFELHNLIVLIRTRFKNLLIWFAPSSLMRSFLDIFPDLVFHPGLGEGPPAEPRHEVFALKFLQFCCAGP